MWEDTAGFPNGECEASPHLQCQDEVKSLTLAIFFLEWLRNGFINKAYPPFTQNPCLLLCALILICYFCKYV